MTTVTDDFNRTDASDLGANWSPGYGGTMQLGVSSNQLYLSGSDSDRVAARYNAATFGNAQYTQIKVIALPASAATWLPLGGLQISASAFGYYGLTYQHSPGIPSYTWRIRTASGGTLKEFQHQLAANDVVRFEYDGTNLLTVKVNGSTITTHTDSAPRTGNQYIGLYSYSMPSGDTWKLDDFEGGDLVAASPTITLTDPVAVVTGATAVCTITRSTAASGTITYNLTSSATGVATVPATATIADGQTTGTFNITGVSAGSSTITATNAADSGETDTATANVSALKGLDVTFGQANLSGLTFAWFDEASPDLFAAPTVVGTTESTDGSGVMSINLTGTSVAVGNTGFLLIYKAGATAPDDIAFFGRMTVADIG